MAGSKKRSNYRFWQAQFAEIKQNCIYYRRTVLFTNANIMKNHPKKKQKASNPQWIVLVTLFLFFLSCTDNKLEYARKNDMSTVIIHSF